jgi:SAM-dependent methyltransferase
MDNCIQEEIDSFADFISSETPTDLDSYKKEFFKRIDRIARMIENHPNREALENQFFQKCSLIDSSIMHNRTRYKPLGYAGDYQLIDWIYTRETAPSGRGKQFDRLFHTYEAAESVRNRKKFFVKKCLELASRKKSHVDILNVGCGSCRDVLELFQSTNNGVRLNMHCVDHEPEAIAYAKKLLSRVRVHHHVHLETANVFRLKTNQKYDLIWSGGLFDYLEDRVAILLLKKLWRNLKDDGQIIFGNFSPKNPTRNGMELVGKWYLIHRTANNLVRLVKATQLPYSKVEITQENLGINLFCVIHK